MINIEIKARCTDRERAEESLTALGAGPAGMFDQRDTYFNVREGRLKLRLIGPDDGHLIFYRREDISGPKRSDYEIAFTTDPEALELMLREVLGSWIEVEKRREVWLWENVRIHLDEIKDLGTYVELEAVTDRVLDGRIWSHPRLAGTPDHLRRLNDIAFSGDGEPTTEKRFPEAVQLAADLLDRRKLADVRIVLITDAACLHHDRVIRGLDTMHGANGVIWAKLDAGTPESYERVNRTMVPFGRVLANLAMAARTYRVIVQSLFFVADGDPPTEAEISAYVDRLVEIEAEGPIAPEWHTRPPAVVYVGRNPSAAPATGLAAIHQRESDELLEAAFAE